MRKIAIAPTLFIVLAASALVVALAFARSAEAKGPFEARITGHGLSAEVTIPVSEMQKLPPSAVFGDGHYGTPPGPAPQDPYTIKLYSDEGGAPGKMQFMTSLSYYSAETGRPALMRDERGFFKADPAFTALLDRYIEAAPAHLPAAGGPPASDGTSALWYIAACLSLTAALAGGIAGRRLLMRRTS